MLRLKSGEILETIILGKSAAKNPIVKEAIASVDEIKALQALPS